MNVKNTVVFLSSISRERSSGFLTSLATTISERKVAIVMNAGRLSYENGNFFIPTTKFVRRHLDKDRTILILNKITSLDIPLLASGFTAVTFDFARNMARHYPVFKRVMEENNIPVPKYKISEPMKLPFILKRTSSPNTQPAYIDSMKELDDYVSDGDEYIAEESIGDNRDYQGSFRVLVFAKKYVGMYYRLNPNAHVFEPNSYNLLSFPITKDTSLANVTVRKQSPIDPNIQRMYNRSPDDRLYPHWKKLSKEELVTIKTVLEEDGVKLDHRLVPVEIPEVVIDLAVKATNALHLGLAVVNIALDKKHKPFVISVKPKFDLTVESNVFNADNMMEYLVGTLVTKGGMFHNE